MTNNKGSKLLFFLMIGIIFLSGLTVLLINFIMSNSSLSLDEALEKFRNGIIDKDASLIAETLHPNFIEIYEENSNNTYVDELQTMFDYIDERIINYRIDYDYYTPTRSESNEFMEELDDYYDIDADSIEEIRLYDATISFKYDGEYEYVEDEVILFKINGGWYIYHDDFVDDIVY